MTTHFSGDIFASGVGLLGTRTGKSFYADSVLGNAKYPGDVPGEAKATVTTALALCTANQGDVVYVMPGHVESIANAQLDWAVAGVDIIGLGRGAARPRFDYDHANASINIGASSMSVKNITLRPSVTNVLVGIDVETLFTDVLLDDIEALPGEDGGGVDDFALVVDIKVGCSRTHVNRLKVRQHASAAGYIAGIRLTGASDDVRITDPDINIIGAGVLAPINGITTLSTNFNVSGGTLTTDAEPGIEMLTGTTGVIQKVNIFSNLATVAAAIVADGCALFENYYVEVAPETGALIGTASAND
jgi:hypothetical protein